MKKTGIFLALVFITFAATAQKHANSALVLKTADSLFNIKQWKTAREVYTRYLKDTSTNALAWNRLGYSNQNLGNYDEALRNYDRALSFKPAPPVRSIVSIRTARIYSVLNKIDSVPRWLRKSAAMGYNVLPDLDTLADFKNVRRAPNFADIRKEAYEAVYPCSGVRHSHDFDFWIGEWDVYKTGTQQLAGHSSVQSMAGDCAILENWTSTQVHTGKSFNFYDESTGLWEQDWIGASGARDRQRYYNGVYEDGVMHFTYETTDAQGKKVTGNFKFYNIDKNTVRQYQDVNNDDGKTVTVSYDFTYIRKKQ